MRPIVSYEWIVEYFDEDGEMEEIVPFGTAKEAIEASARRGGDNDIGLVRDEVDSAGRLLRDGRQWAYVEGGQLPEKFDGGAKVPKRFIDEWSKQ